MSLTLTVHRGTHQIGGTCIEIEHASGERLILDAGRQLDAPEGASDVLPASLDRNRPATVLISHPHQDHWGVIDQLPVSWPVWTGSKSAQLIAIPGELLRRPLTRPFMTWDSRSEQFAVGPFGVTPMLTDHSAFDAYMLLIEADGKRILYTGDFRRHGRKSVLVDRMMAKPPADIDVLIIEGTNLGSEKPVMTEEQLEEDFVDLFNRTKGRVFVSWLGQNIDRTVTLYRAARRTQRTLVIDLYTADVLDRVSEGTGLPHPGERFPYLKVVITKRLRSAYGRFGLEDLVRPALTQLRVKTPKRVIVPLTVDEVSRFWSSFRTSRDLAIVGLMLLHGLRSCEVLALNREDVQLPDSQIRVPGKGKKIRVLPLARESVELLDHYMRLERPARCGEAMFVCLKGPVRGTRMTPAGLRSLFRHHRLTTGVRQANPHRFRHTFATEMVLAGISLPALMQLMGHAHIQTTMVYVQLTPRDVWEQYARAVAHHIRPVPPPPL